MSDLLERSRDLDVDIYRNIVSLRKSQNLFEDLTDDEQETQIAIAAEMRVKQDIPAGIIHRGFHYNTAIAYPFETEPYMHSRYSNGSFPVWYGSLELITTVYETAYHMIRTESGVEGLDEIIIRERAAYKVHCQALLIDISDKHHEQPSLISNDYSFTQQLGQRLAKEGHPGLLYRSARCQKRGINTAVFTPKVLSNPRLSRYFTYKFNPKTRGVQVEEKPGTLLLNIS